MGATIDNRSEIRIPKTLGLRYSVREMPASHVFIDYHCPFRKDGDTSKLHHLLRLRRHLAGFGGSEGDERTITLKVFDGTAWRDRVYTQADLRMAEARLAEIYPVCESCPANLKRTFGIRDSVGCHAVVTRPLDEFAERILYETLNENLKAERFATEQSSLVRAVLVSSMSNGKQWESSTANLPNGGVTQWGSAPVAVAIGGRQFQMTVHAIIELLYMSPYFPLRAVEDTLSFFRSFFAVVGTYVSDREGKLDQRRNEMFWRQSMSLNELNLFIQLLKHAARLGRGARSAVT